MRAGRAAWTIAAIAVVFLPLILDLLSGASFQDTGLVNVSVGLGLLATSLLLVVVAPVLRLRSLSRLLGLATSQQFHKWMGVAAVLLVLAHLVVALFTVPQGIGLLNVFDTTTAARFAVVSTVALLALGIGAVPRGGSGRYVLRLRLHAGLAALAIVTAGLHIGLLGRLVRNPVMAGVLMALALLALLLLGRRYVWRPLMGKGDYVVYGVRPESDTTVTLVLAPVHLRRRLTFEPGQFVWLRLHRTPLADEHPFTIASSAANGGRVELTIREAGDFTARIAELEKGRPVWLDGPFGDLVPSPTQAGGRPAPAEHSPSGAWTRPERDVVVTPESEGVEGFVLVAGGVGITPIMGMLRTLADTEDPRPVRLLLAERDDDPLFPDELEVLTRRIDLAITRTHGRRMSIDLLSELLPAGARARWDYFLCGPSKLTDAGVEALAACGVPSDRIRTESFG